MTTMRDRLSSEQGEAKHKLLVDLHMEIVAAEYELRVLQARQVLAIHDFKQFCCMDISDAEEKDFKAASKFLEEMKNEEA